MKTVTTLTCLCLPLLAPSCLVPASTNELLEAKAIAQGMKEIARHVREKKHAPPESEWNGARIWTRVAAQPATYIPTGYPTRAPRSAAHGEWIEDARDGKRFFVPKGGIDGLNEAVIRKDALKHSGSAQ